MPITKAVLKVQINRLVALPAKDNSLFGVDPQEIRNELGRALERHASTDDEAIRTVDWLIFKRPSDERIFRPQPGEIPDAITRVREIASDQADRPQGCEICNGAPWVTVTKLVWEFPKAAEGRRGIQYETQGSKRCDCAKGQWFRQKDRENDAKRAAGLPV